MTSTPTLTIDQTDELILKACTPEDGAIEDAEVSETEVSYFFESGAVGTVSRVRGAVQITSAHRSR
ncbi:hypothetical protein FTW19_11530 [Terriglobus albidus]|uniref:Uncharacterized protein n=1 Tax=Terriglobus albidus TaxID=1592106 RepID=A0A5B9EDV8_9BACT|nr:hypothetical protein [Terriglobus albidus]QEE28571.1 hypothetical protein FTW19_11530 [Terriglobus albidus]